MSVRESGEMVAQTKMARVLNDTDSGVVISGMNSAVRLGFHHTQGRRDGGGKFGGVNRTPVKGTGAGAGAGVGVSPTN